MSSDPSSFALAGVGLTIILAGAILWVGVPLMGLALVVALKRTTQTINDAGTRVQAFSVATGMSRVASERVERDGPDGREHVELGWSRTRQRVHPPVLRCGIALAHPFQLGMRITQRTGGLDPIVALGVVQAVAIADPDLAARLRVITRDSAGAAVMARVLAASEIRAALASLPRDANVEIDDRQVFITEPGWEGLSPEHVESLLTMIRPVARAFAAVAARHPTG